MVRPADDAVIHDFKHGSDLILQATTLMPLLPIRPASDDLADQVRAILEDDPTLSWDAALRQIVSE